MNTENQIYNIKTYNNINPRALSHLTANYSLNNDEEDIDAIIVRSADLHQMEIPESLEFVGRAGSGVNNIPIDKLTEQGIVVANAPGANANGVKELVLSALIISSRHLDEAAEWTKELKGQDNIEEKVEKGKKLFNGPELAGKKIGVIGLGAIGVKVANMCIELDMDVYGLDPYLSVKHALGLNPRTKTEYSLNYIMENCDYITLHIPYNENTKNYLDSKELAKSKKGQIIINCARDGLVNIDALEESLNNRTVACYVSDFPTERSLEMPNTINFPHLGASTPESEENAASMVVDQLMDYIENGNIRNSVNYPNINFGKISSECRVTVHHQNIPNMIGQITGLLAKRNLNINRLTNKPRDQWAYTMIDLDNSVNQDDLNAILAIEGVVKVRYLLP